MSNVTVFGAAVGVCLCALTVGFLFGGQWPVVAGACTGALLTAYGAWDLSRLMPWRGK